MSLLTVLGAGAAVVATLLVAGLIYRDAARVGVDLGSPTLWAGFVVITAGAALITSLLVPDAPLPGVLVLAALGPLLYLLERDDSMHGDDPADPMRLPSETSAADDPDDPGDSAERDATDQTEPIDRDG
jgi:type III secretory pathway component EscV